MHDWPLVAELEQRDKPWMSVLGLVGPYLAMNCNTVTNGKLYPGTAALDGVNDDKVDTVNNLY